MIAVIIPTRGTIVTAVIQGVIDNCSGRDWTLLTTSDLGLPECMNTLVDRALDLGAEWIWVVEEDTVPPAGVLDALLADGGDYVACDYPVGAGHTCFGFDGDGLLWTGLGCTLIRASVFDRLERPYFACNMNMVVQRRWGLDYFTADNRTVNHRGGHDLSFCKKLKDAGIERRGLVGWEATHLKVTKLNEEPTNHACHTLAPVSPIVVPWTEYVSGKRATVVIPCYNHAEFLPQAIESALAQTMPVEVIVVDDGSTDDTAKVARRYPVKLIRHKKNRGLSAARNTGIAAANTTYILPLDADDWIEPNTVELLIGLDDIVAPSVTHFGTVEAAWIPPLLHPTCSDFTAANHCCCTALYLREVWEEIGGYDENMLDGWEDWDFWVRAADAGFTFTVVSDRLLHYRRHPRGETDRQNSSWRARAKADEITEQMHGKWRALGIMLD